MAAQAAANYMDYKAGLITEKEYEKACGAVMEVKQKSREMERQVTIKSVWKDFKCKNCRKSEKTRHKN